MTRIYETLSLWLCVNSLFQNFLPTAQEALESENPHYQLLTEELSESLHGIGRLNVSLDFEMKMVDLNMGSSYGQKNTQFTYSVYSSSYIYLTWKIAQLSWENKDNYQHIESISLETSEGIWAPNILSRPASFSASPFDDRNIVHIRRDGTVWTKKLMKHEIVCYSTKSSAYPYDVHRCNSAILVQNHLLQTYNATLKCKKCLDAAFIGIDKFSLTQFDIANVKLKLSKQSYFIRFDLKRRPQFGYLIHVTPGILMIIVLAGQLLIPLGCKERILVGLFLFFALDQLMLSTFPKNMETGGSSEWLTSFFIGLQVLQVIVLVWTTVAYNLWQRGSKLSTRLPKYLDRLLLVNVLKKIIFLPGAWNENDDKESLSFENPFHTNESSQKNTSDERGMLDKQPENSDNANKLPSFEVARWHVFVLFLDRILFAVFFIFGFIVFGVTKPSV